jgi:bifunctional non-homologous end joining protein LigD
LGLEGLIGKRSGSRYEAAKRSGTSVKIKRHQEQEFAIGGYTDPKGLESILARCWLASTKQETEIWWQSWNRLQRKVPAHASQLNNIRAEECPFFSLPPAGRSRWQRELTAAEMKRCHWVKPTMVCQIKFAEWTQDDRLRQQS